MKKYLVRCDRYELDKEFVTWQAALNYMTKLRDNVLTKGEYIDVQDIVTKEYLVINEEGTN